MCSLYGLSRLSFFTCFGWWSGIASAAIGSMPRLGGCDLLGDDGLVVLTDYTGSFIQLGADVLLFS